MCVPLCVGRDLVLCLILTPGQRIVLQAATGGDRTILIKVRTPLRVVDALVEYISSLLDGDKADALIMGSRLSACAPEHKRNAQMYGATTDDINALVPIPVYLVRCRTQPPSTPGATSGRSVVIAVDGRTPTSLLLTKWALANALRVSDSVRLVHMPASGSIPKASAEAESGTEAVEGVLSSCKAALTEGGVKDVRPEVRSDRLEDARDALVDLSEAGDAPELMILASRGPSALKRATLGSVCSYVVMHASCSLAIVPPLALLHAGGGKV